MYTYTWNPNDPCFEWSFGLLLEGSNPKIEDKQVPSTQHKYSKSNQEQWHNIDKIRLYIQYPFFLNMGSLTSIIHELGHPEAPRLGQAFSATWRLQFSRGILSIHSHLLNRKHSNYTPKTNECTPKKGSFRKKRLVFQPLFVSFWDFFHCSNDFFPQGSLALDVTIQFWTSWTTWAAKKVWAIDLLLVP